MLSGTVVFLIMWSFVVGAVNGVGYVLINQPREKLFIIEIYC